MAYLPVSGTAGRVATTSGHTPQAGLKTWKLNKKLNMIPTPQFELVADANGVTWNQFILFGLAEATADLEGFFDIGNNTEVVFFIGAILLLDLVFNKTSSFGYLGLVGTLMEFNPSVNIENTASAFSGKVQLTGTIAAAA